MKSVAIFLSAVLIVSFLPIYAPPEASDQDKFNWADVIVTGKIISYSKPESPPNVMSSIDTIYEVQVDKYIKNDLHKDVISVIAHGGPDAELEPMLDTVNFDVGDNVFLYLNY